MSNYRDQVDEAVTIQADRFFSWAEPASVLPSFRVLRLTERYAEYDATGFYSTVGNRQQTLVLSNPLPSPEAIGLLISVSIRLSFERIVYALSPPEVCFQVAKGAP